MSIDDFKNFNVEADAAAAAVAINNGYEEKLSPHEDQVVVRRCQAAKRSTGGILLAAKEAINQGLVIAAGPDSGYKAGDHVAFGPFAGTTQIKLNGEMLLVLRKSEISGTMVRIPLKSTVKENKPKK